MIVSFKAYTPAARYDAVAWNRVRVEESIGSTGPWSVIDTLDLDPADADPASPAARNLTTANGTGPGLWYRLTSLDASDNTGEPSGAIQNALPAAQFVTSDEFAERLGITLTDEEAARAETLLTLASGLIQQETKQTIALVTDETYTRPGDYDTRVRLPQRPVVSVSSVVLNGVALEPGVNFYVDRDELVRLNWNAVVQDSTFGLPWAGFGFPWWTLEVVYTHGYDTIPELVKAVCMEMATRVWVNPGSVARESVGNTMTVYDNNRFSPTGLLLTETEKTDLNKLLRRHSGTIALR